MRGLGGPADLIRLIMQGQVQGVTIPEILSSSEQAFMASVWPQIRVAANFADINWTAGGYPNGPPLSPVSHAAITYVWPQIRVAANWSDPRWEYHRVPASVIAAALPPPELPSAEPAAEATPAPPAATAGPSFAPSGSGYDPYANYAPGSDPLPDTGEPNKPKVKPVQAGLFGLSWPALLSFGLLASIALGAFNMKPARGRNRRPRR